MLFLFVIFLVAVIGKVFGANEDQIMWAAAVAIILVCVRYIAIC